MNVGQLEKEYRVQTGDTVAAKYLCSKADFLLRLNEAQCEAARRSHCLVDSTSALSRVVVPAGVATIDLDERIIKVRRICLLPRYAPLRMISARTLDEAHPGWEIAPAGTPTHFVPDWGTGVLRLHRAPSMRVELSLTVVREPLDPLAKPEDVPEIRARHHLSLIEWVKYRTYSTQDPDNFDPQAAEKALTAFTLEFGPANGAIDEHWAAEQAYDVGEF